MTDRGTPVARLIGVEGASVIDRLTAEGRLSRPESRDRPDPRAEEPIRPSASVSELIVAGTRSGDGRVLRSSALVKLVVEDSDALHLAAALTIAGAEPVVATWDRRLLAACQESGLATLPAHL